MAIAKICGLGSGKLNFGHDIGRVSGNSGFRAVALILKYISAQEMAGRDGLPIKAVYSSIFVLAGANL